LPSRGLSDARPALDGTDDAPRARGVAFLSNGHPLGLASGICRYRPVD